MGSSNAGDVIFKSGNVERMRILSSGLNVGIGTTSPTGILQIHNPSGSSYIHITNNSVGQTANDGVFIGQLSYTTMFQLKEANQDYTCFEFKNVNSDILFRINSMGSVGIGTFNHESKFQINGNAAIGYSDTVKAPTNGLSVYGNVGIGTKKPSAKLEVIGKIKIVDSTQGVNKVLTSDANGLARWSTISGAGGITSACTTVNIVPKMTSNNVIECSQIFDDGKNVGIGTTNPIKKLMVAGSTYVQDSLFIGNSLIIDSLAGEGFKFDSLSTKSYNLLFTDEKGTILTLHQTEIGPQMHFCGEPLQPWNMGGNQINSTNSFANYIGTCNEWPFRIKTNGTERMRITPEGNVGIGTTSPVSLLHVNLPANAPLYTKAASFSLSNNQIFICPNNIESGYSWETLEGDACIFWTDGQGSNGANLNSGFVLAPATGAHYGIRITPNGNLLIGKPSQTSNEAPFKLDVAGSIRCDNTVCIGTTTTSVGGIAYKLTVNGKILAKEIVVETNWSDFVFEKDYDLMPLSEVEKYINLHKHLPDVPSASEVEKNGVALGQTQSLLLQKIEELTLYTIEMNKQLELLKAQNRVLQNEVNLLKNSN